MSIIRVPFSELISLITGTIDQWPKGHKFIKDNGDLDRDRIISAAGSFTSDVIYQQYTDPNKDPIHLLLMNAGYPTPRMKNSQLEDLFSEIDDIYLLMMNPLTGYLERLKALLTDTLFTRSIQDEDVIIHVSGGRWRLNYQELLKEHIALKKKHNRRTGSSTNYPTGIHCITEVDDLDMIEEYIESTIGVVLNEIDDLNIRDEAKRIITQVINRY